MFSVYGTKGLKPDTLRPLAQSETDAQFIAKERNQNPTLDDLTKAALEVLGKDKDGMWLMIEGGDIDWSEHDDNIDNAIGATLDFDKAVGSVIDWISKNGGWDQNELIVTADHDHYLTLNDNFPKLLREQGGQALTDIDTSVGAGHYWGSKPTEVMIPDPKDPTKMIVDPESGECFKEENSVENQGFFQITKQHLIHRELGFLMTSDARSTKCALKRDAHLTECALKREFTVIKLTKIFTISQLNNQFLD